MQATRRDAADERWNELGSRVAAICKQRVRPTVTELRSSSWSVDEGSQVPSGEGGEMSKICINFYVNSYVCAGEQVSVSASKGLYVRYIP